jgi:uncharacterized protein
VRACGPISFKALSNGMTFITPPLAAELHIIGPSAAKLFVSSSTEDADLFLVLRLFSGFQRGYFLGLK